MDFETRKHLFNLCNPEEALAPGDPRFVDLDGAGDPPARGIRWADALATPIEASPRPVRQLITAIPGTGLSTELSRLASRLGEPPGANLLVARADAANFIDLTRALDVADVLLVVLGTAHDAAARAGGGGPALVAGRIRRFLPDVAGVAPDEDLSWPRGLAELRHVVLFRERFRANVSAEFSHFVAEVRDELARLRDAARRTGRAGILVILDSLEKLSGLVDTRAAVLASAERVFGADAEYLDLPVHTVYTLPPALLLRLRGPLHVLPALRVRTRDGRPDEAGLAAARALVRARVPDEALDDLLGSDLREARVRELVEQSAGRPRDLVKVLQRVVGKAALDARIFDQLLGAMGEIPRRLVGTRAYPWLTRMAATKAITPVEESVRSSADVALEVGAVLPYRDAEGTWFDIVPAVREMPGVAEAMAEAGSPV